MFIGNTFSCQCPFKFSKYFACKYILLEQEEDYEKNLNLAAAKATLQMYLDFGERRFNCLYTVDRKSAHVHITEFHALKG
jgi:hypothetical protein